VKKHALFNGAGRILLAVSGGCDSTALLYVLMTLRGEGIIQCPLICAHVNHKLRGAAGDRDEEFVVRLSKRLNLPVVTRSVDVPAFAKENKLSIETAARQLRIESLLDIAGAHGCDWIATGHQKNDNAETILLRLSRGTGFRGLAGIWPVRRFDKDIRFARPLLCVGRDELADYLEKKNIEWRKDHTNTDVRYRRNFIRHRLMPALQRQCTASLVDLLSELAEHAGSFYHNVCSRADTAWPKLAKVADGKIALDIKQLFGEDEAVRVELVRRCLVLLGCGERKLTERHYATILELARSGAGGRVITLPDGCIAEREQGKLVFQRPTENTKEPARLSRSFRIRVPGRTRFGGYLVEAKLLKMQQDVLDALKTGKTRFEEWFDLDKITLPLTIRPRKVGDRFRPLGLRGEKKVGKFLTASKIPQSLRKKILVVEDGEKIIWVWPIRISEKVKLDDKTRNVLQLRIEELETKSG